MHETSRGVFDAFLSWGWSDGPRVVPLGFHREPVVRRTQSDLLVVLGPITRQTDSLSTLDASRIVDLRRFITDFVALLPHHIRERVVVRPKIGGKGKPARLDTHAAATLFAGLPLSDPSQDLVEAMSRCRVMVVTSPQTTFAVSASGEIPTIAAWPDGWLVSTDAIRAMLESYRRAGALVVTAQELAARICQIWNDPVGWWTHSSVTDVRLVHHELLARATDDLPRSMARSVLQRASATNSTVS
jgi:putative transferase (TIGR04331 family)